MGRLDSSKTSGRCRPMSSTRGIGHPESRSAILTPSFLRRGNSRRAALLACLLDPAAPTPPRSGGASRLGLPPCSRPCLPSSVLAPRRPPFFCRGASPGSDAALPWNLTARSSLPCRRRASRLGLHGRPSRPLQPRSETLACASLYLVQIAIHVLILCGLEILIYLLSDCKQNQCHVLYCRWKRGPRL